MANLSSLISTIPAALSPTEMGYLDGVTGPVQTQLNAKQDALISGTNTKTINGESLLSAGDIVASSQPSVSVYQSQGGL